MAKKFHWKKKKTIGMLLNRRQWQRDFDPTDTLHFFGDAMGPTGNDYPLKKVIIDNDLGICYNVNSWKDTRELLNEKKY